VGRDKLFRYTVPMSSFAKEYSRLNKNQQIAVDTIDGPVMVMAGPGTGKTQVLTLRIANILKKTDALPSSILCLTFTDAASNEMRQRLVNLIGQSAYSIQIHTFHSFCQSVILENPDLFIMAEETLALQELNRTKILQEIIQTNKFSLLKPLNAPFYYCQSIIEKIRVLKREGVSPEEFKKILNKQKKDLLGQADSLSKTSLAKEEKDLKKNLDLQKIYSLYQKEITKKGLFDFEDMINWVVDKFNQDPDLLLSYQEQLTYFLVDEYQDTNSAQNQLTFSLASFWAEKANLFVVGDPNQSIFRFQGASLENTKEFISRFPNTTLINLDQNYRSTKNILSASHGVIKNNYKDSSPQSGLLELSQSSGATKLKSNLPGSGKLINVANFTHSIFEDYFIAQKAKNLLRRNVKPQDIAIIVRHNKDLDDISSTLKKFNLPFTVQGTQDLLEQPLIKKILVLLTVINNTPNQHLDTEIFTFLNYDFLKINPLSILKTAKKASDKHLHLASYVLSSKYDVPSDIKTFFENLNKWQRLSANSTLPEFFEILIQQSGILNHLLKQRNKADEISKLNMFFTQIKNMAFHDRDLNLTKFLNNVEAIKEQKIKTAFVSPVTLKKSITLTTTHKAKGLEWEHVFLYRVTDGKWGNPRIRQLIKLPKNLLEFADIQDPQKEERRLFYVGLTRAKEALYLTSANQYTTDYGTQNTLPSLFISEIPNKLIRKIDPKNIENNSIEVMKKLLVSPTADTTTAKEREYLATLVKDVKLSVTALNTFLDCGYKYKLNNLYRLPKAKEAYLAFGTAAHFALEKYFSKPNLKLLLNQFEKALKQELLTPADYSARLKHGVDVLTSYHKLHSANLNPVHALEKYFGHSGSGCYLDDISLVGKVDRIDILDKEKKLVKIIDYKTGKPKTRGEVEGTTQTSTGYLKRQLVFYALLTKLDKHFPFKAIQFELDFVEGPFLNGKSGQMIFTVTDKEIGNLKLEIKKSVKKIRSLNFPRTKDATTCQRCEFKDHCYPQGLPKTILYKTPGS
jgi:DNA helicase II / ATP-dependent DNA helicase PcrA